MTDQDASPSGFNHLVLTDEVATPEGWRVWCVPHGPLGAYPSPVQAFLRALEHDVEHGGGACR